MRPSRTPGCCGLAPILQQKRSILSAAFKYKVLKTGLGPNTHFGTNTNTSQPNQIHISIQQQIRCLNSNANTLNLFTQIRFRNMTHINCSSTWYIIVGGILSQNVLLSQGAQLKPTIQLQKYGTCISFL